MIFTDVTKKKAFVSLKIVNNKIDHKSSSENCKPRCDTTFILYQRICRAYNFVLLRQSFMLIQMQQNVCGVGNI